MPWFNGDRRGSQGWRGDTMSSLALPPLPLIAVFAIVILFLSLSWHVDYGAKVEQFNFHLSLLLIFATVILVFVVWNTYVNGRLVVRLATPEQEAIDQSGSSPWGVAALLVLLLVMISYQSSFKWFRPLWWRSSYYY